MENAWPVLKCGAVQFFSFRTLLGALPATHRFLTAAPTGFRYEILSLEIIFMGVLAGQLIEYDIQQYHATEADITLHKGELSATAGYQVSSKKVISPEDGYRLDEARGLELDCAGTSANDTLVTNVIYRAVPA